MQAVHHAQAVSYTHLDVYKRQVNTYCQRIRNAVWYTIEFLIRIDVIMGRKGTPEIRPLPWIRAQMHVGVFTQIIPSHPAWPALPTGCLLYTSEINGDFVVRGELNQLCNSLVGCEYSKEKVNEILASHRSDNIIYGVSGEELLQAIFS